MSGPYRLGLTGSVGMGKSTTAGLFAEAGVPVWDADAAVHRLYAAGGGGAAALADLVPEAVKDGAVDRDRLRRAVAATPSLLDRIEARIHPLVAADRAAFAAAHAGAELIVFDIPLLYETGAEPWLDGVLVVTAAGGGAAGAGAGAAGDDGGDVRADPGAADARTPRSGRGPISSSTTDRGIDAARADVLELLERIRAERSRA